MFVLSTRCILSNSESMHCYFLFHCQEMFYLYVLTVFDARLQTSWIAGKEKQLSSMFL